MSFAVTGCQQDQRIQTDRDVLRVGVVTYTQDDPFINALTDKLKEDLKAMSTKDVKVIVSVKNGDNDQKNQDETIEEMIYAGCDVLCYSFPTGRICDLIFQQFPLHSYNQSHIHQEENKDR